VADELRLVFMGTPEFAVPSLESVLRLGDVAGQRTRVVGVFTQPDRPAGRGQKISISPVKAAAIAAGLAVFQPEKLRRSDAMSTLRSLEPDLIVVAAYAQILSGEVLRLPRYGCLNVHGSLLPRYRGAAPVHAAILDGAASTGISIMLMDEGLDTGPVLSQIELPIDAQDTGATLSGKLALLGAQLLGETIGPWIAGSITPQAQNDELATVTRRLRKADGRIDWSGPAEQIARQVRAMNPWPSAHTYLDDVLLKIIAAHASPSVSGHGCPGMVLLVDDGPAVTTGQGILLLDIVQPAGKRQMSGKEWLQGAPRAIGSVLQGGN
jgi:methionyl-tRNA formyltransferase